jgi:hypothetical protein
MNDLKSKKVSYENNGYRPIASSYIDASKRKEILRGINGKRAESRQGGDVLRNAVKKAIRRELRMLSKNTILKAIHSTSKSFSNSSDSLPLSSTALVGGGHCRKFS